MPEPIRGFRNPFVISENGKVENLKGRNPRPYWDSFTQLIMVTIEGQHCLLSSVLLDAFDSLYENQNLLEENFYKGHSTIVNIMEAYPVFLDGNQANVNLDNLVWQMNYRRYQDFWKSPENYDWRPILVTLRDWQTNQIFHDRLSNYMEQHNRMLFTKEGIQVELPNHTLF